jgi:hypothetical protein
VDEDLSIIINETPLLNIVIEETQLLNITISQQSMLAPIEVYMTLPPIIVPSEDVSKTITYNLNGTINVIISSKGTKTMVYNLIGFLTKIIGTGEYKSKNFIYTNNKLTAIEVI